MGHVGKGAAMIFWPFEAHMMLRTGNLKGFPERIEVNSLLYYMNMVIRVEKRKMETLFIWKCHKNQLTTKLKVQVLHAQVFLFTSSCNLKAVENISSWQRGTFLQAFARAHTQKVAMFMDDTILAWLSHR